jgi:ABC-2 type transport system ATP-binding protein
MTTAIAVEQLVMRYPSADKSSPAGGVTAVDNISFSAQSGEVFCLLGPNGAGKTSTVETLEGYRTPSKGSVRVLGLNPIGDAKALAPRIGVMLQRNGVYLTMGPREVLRLFAAYYGRRATNPDQLLDRVGLGNVAKTPWRRLSGGEQQRLSLALALVGRPEVAFLDEPTASIDPAARLVVREIITELRADGVCVLLTTHDLDEAEKLADRVAIIDHGKIVGSGTLAELRQSSHPETIRFAAESIDVADLGGTLNAEVKQTAPGEFEAHIPPSPQNVAALTSWLAQRNVALGSLRAGSQSLEDVFLRLTRDSTDISAASDTGGTPSDGQRQRGRGRKGRS